MRGLRRLRPLLGSHLLVILLKLGSPVSSARSLILGLSSSEELDTLSINVSDIGDSPATSPQYEELMEVVFRAVSKLNID